MYRKIYTKQFQKSFNKILSSGKIKREDIENPIDILSNVGILPRVYKDHKLNGEYVGYNEFHVKGDLLIIYKIEKDILILILVDIGSHSELF